MRDKKIILDLDLNLLDTQKLKNGHNEALVKELGVSWDDFRKAVDGYYQGVLEETTDFNPESFVEYLAEVFSADRAPLLQIYEGDEIYKGSLYPETLDVLDKLSKKWTLGVYTEGHKDYQMRKLTKTGIIDYLDKGLIFIFNRKKVPENINKLPQSIVVDDRADVVTVLKDYSHITPVLMDRDNNKEAPGIEKISSLTELPSLIEKL